MPITFIPTQVLDWWVIDECILRWLSQHCWRLNWFYNSLHRSRITIYHHPPGNDAKTGILNQLNSRVASVATLESFWLWVGNSCYATRICGSHQVLGHCCRDWIYQKIAHISVEVFSHSFVNLNSHTIHQVKPKRKVLVVYYLEIPSSEST